MKMRVAASVALAGLIVLGASGCEFISPQDTTQISQVSDGMDATLGPVDVRNALLFTADGTDAALVTRLINSSTSAQTVSMQYTSSTGSTTQQVSVPANSAITIRPGVVSPGAQTSITLTGVNAKAGSLFPIYFTVGRKNATLRVPVLDASLPGYQTLTPTPTPPAPLPTPTDTSGVTPSPTDSATPAA